MEINPAIETDPFRGGETAKQQAKIDFMRRRNADRVKRLLNSKQRAIGADPSALAAQIAEREEAKLEEAEETAAYVEYEAHMRGVVGEREQRFQAQDKEYLREMAREWDGEAGVRKERALKEKGEDLRCDPKKTGPAGAQVFDGEDPTAEERRKLQGLNVRTWLAQQEAEKMARKDEDQDELLRYAAYERFVSAERADLEDEENEMRKQTRYELKEQNLGDAQRRRDSWEARKREVQGIEALEIDRRLNDPELCENTAVARSALGAHRYRPDHFKGFAPEQIAQLLRENEYIAKEHNAAKDEERQIDDEYDASQAELLALAHDEEERYQHELRRRAKKLEDDIVTQRSQQRERKLKSDRDRFGSVAPGGFLDGFGKSAR
jgi:hypothetical protein